MFRYRELWDEFLGARPKPKSKRDWLTSLCEWRHWGEKDEQKDLSSFEKLMTRGPQRSITTFTRANVNGIKLRTKGLDGNKKSCNSYFMVEYKNNEGNTDMDIGRAEYFFMHCPVGYLIGGDNLLVPFVKAKWYAKPIPQHNAAGLKFITTVEMQGTSEEFLSPIWHAARILDIGVSLAPVDEYHRVPSPIKVGRTNIEREQLKVVIESTRRISCQVQGVDINAEYGRL